MIVTPSRPPPTTRLLCYCTCLRLHFLNNHECKPPPALQIPFDATVRISLDTNLCMIKENPEDGPSCAATGRWWVGAAGSTRPGSSD